jgi:hypothetical protein
MKSCSSVSWCANTPLRRLQLALHHAHRGQVDLRSVLWRPEPHRCEGGALQRFTGTAELVHSWGRRYVFAWA